METTRSQRARILEYKKQNGGVIRSDADGSILDQPTQNITKGQKANMNQAEVDHIQERVEGGSNSNKNQRVISKRHNVDKEVNRKSKKT